MTTLDEIFGLRGHRAIVTGASSGLGVEFAEALAMAGCAVALVARREERLRQVATQLEPYGVAVAVVPADLTEADAAKAIFDTAESALGPIDILVNNAGLLAPARAERMSAERWTNVIEMNLTAVFRLSQEFGRRRIARSEGGRIVNVGSIFGAVASVLPGSVAYAASKGGITMLTRSLAVEWATRGITVNQISPGTFPTEMNTPDFERAPELLERIQQATPLGRLGRPGELRSALLFLTSPASSYVTGATVFVDGGYTAW